ncbi:CehA/McbA family metallohydrolase [Verrucosispora sioxanthis]|uniref:CehA/McbA family metallohydrolase n=1 Tax=Verrucosispora sioxanthis TaxID=2499994 RepID=A0A6M1KXY9_9ACTN|nr:CehA/McbA family metallohydrolase [Verrucosispora sioxanthis]NEE63779.1 CehA/McbA family metallohydrolase [Verrucosispora sioxanthis]NGM12889.1 CehA/McbA family metallohydrolase [Verrucosispora sioxanthis]
MTDHRLRHPHGAQHPTRRVAGRGPGWYRGDVHLHTVRSAGGELTPGQLVAAAREIGLDFVATTEHNTAAGHGDWSRHAGDDLLVILGQEVTTHTGHWLALGLEPGHQVEWRYGVRDDVVDRHLDLVRRSGGLCVAAHPYAPYESGTLAYPYRCFDAVEVWNGQWRSDLPWNADNEAALAEWGRNLAHDIHQGRWWPALGNSDTHLAGQLGTPHTVVYAEELSVEAILAGLRAGRSWIAGSAAVDLAFAATTGDRVVGVGEHLDTGGAPIEVRVRVSGAPAGTVSLHTERGTVLRERLPADGSGTVRWHTTARDSGFVRAEVRHPDRRMAALTNPVILA